MANSRRDRFIDMDVLRSIFKSNSILPFPRFTFIPKIGVGLPYQGLIFYCVSLKLFSLVTVTADQK